VVFQSHRHLATFTVVTHGVAHQIGDDFIHHGQVGGHDQGGIRHLNRNHLAAAIGHIALPGNQTFHQATQIHHLKVVSLQQTAASQVSQILHNTRGLFKPAHRSGKHIFNRWRHGASTQLKGRFHRALGCVHGRFDFMGHKAVKIHLCFVCLYQLNLSFQQLCLDGAVVFHY